MVDRSSDNTRKLGRWTCEHVESRTYACDIDTDNDHNSQATRRWRSVGHGG